MRTSASFYEVFECASVNPGHCDGEIARATPAKIIKQTKQPFWPRGAAGKKGDAAL